MKKMSIILILLFFQVILAEDKTLEGKIEAWKEASALLEPAVNHYSFSTENRVAVFVGQSVGFSKAMVFYSEVNNSGLKSWKKTTPTSYSLEQFGVTSNDKFLYIIGGKNMGYERGSVTTFPINNDATLGKAISTLVLPNALVKPAVAINKNFIFVAGGKLNGKASNIVFAAPLNDNGMPQKWMEIKSLPIPLFNHAMFSYKDFIYVSGGYHNGGTVYGAKVNQDGTIEKWIELDDTPISLERHSMLVYNNLIITSGGISNGYPSSEVYVGKFAEEGLVINWIKVQNLPIPVYDQSMTTCNNFIVITGGMSGGRPQAKVFFAPIK